MNLSSVTVLNNQPEVTLRWRFPDLDQLTSTQVRFAEPRLLALPKAAHP
ncbi:MAG: hypothetical protein O2830_01095 [Verrucomicrobia bacterium]|nr:hypothetical protein [Verrucomicrobiota bacterium]MDA0858195.1 hypothetical protein [Verrucomicrobiota bacterium]MDA1340034.1 hypothetical protein [Verrucomicrobiota bacterium]